MSLFRLHKTFANWHLISSPQQPHLTYLIPVSRLPILTLITTRLISLVHKKWLVHLKYSIPYLQFLNIYLFWFYIVECLNACCALHACNACRVQKGALESLNWNYCWPRWLSAIVWVLEVLLTTKPSLQSHLISNVF